MRVVDITGEIREGMWNYEEPFPKFCMSPLGKVPWVGTEVYCEVFSGLHSQTGTYLETPAHFYGNDKCYLMADVPVKKLVNIPCVVMKLEEKLFYDPALKKPIDASMLENCPGSKDIPEGCALLIGTGWGRYWMDKCFLENSPYFTYEAMAWLVSKNPFLLGTDFPRWDNIKNSQGFFPLFYEADILMLAPCVNLEKIENNCGRLTVLPLNIPGTSAAPCRAVFTEGGDCV